FVACGIDPDGGSFGGHTLEFLQHAEVHAMRSEEDVAGQAAQHVEGVDIVGGNTGVRRPLGLCVDQTVAGVDVPASDNNYVASDAVIFGNHGPRGATASVAGGVVRGKHGAAKAHSFAIVQDARNLRGRVELLAAIGEVCDAAIFDDGDIAVHDHVLCVCLFENGGAACVVVGVGVADE